MSWHWGECQALFFENITQLIVIYVIYAKNSQGDLWFLRHRPHKLKCPLVVLGWPTCGGTTSSSAAGWPPGMGTIPAGPHQECHQGLWRLLVGGGWWRLCFKEQCEEPFAKWTQAQGRCATRVRWQALASCCPQLTGILWWAVKLGWINIHLEMAIVPQCQAMPREGHLEAVNHIFACLKKHLNSSQIAFDSKRVKVDNSCFNDEAD